MIATATRPSPLHLITTRYKIVLFSKKKTSCFFTERLLSSKTSYFAAVRRYPPWAEAKLPPLRRPPDLSQSTPLVVATPHFQPSTPPMPCRRPPIPHPPVSVKTCRPPQRVTFGGGNAGGGGNRSGSLEIKSPAPTAPPRGTAGPPPLPPPLPIHPWQPYRPQYR